MARTDRNQVFDRDGNLVSEELVEVPDAVVELERLDEDLRALLPLARTAAGDWTAQDLAGAVRLLLRDRLRRDLLQDERTVDVTGTRNTVEVVPGD